MTADHEFRPNIALDSTAKVDIYFQDETAWLTQQTLAELIGVKGPVTTKASSPNAWRA